MFDFRRSAFSGQRGNGSTDRTSFVLVAILRAIGGLDTATHRQSVELSRPRFLPLRISLTTVSLLLDIPLMAQKSPLRMRLARLLHRARLAKSLFGVVFSHRDIGMTRI